MYSVERAYGRVSNHWGYARSSAAPTNYVVSLHIGIGKLYEALLDGLTGLVWSRKRTLFVSDRKQYPRDLVQIVASIVYESLECISNGFAGVDDDAWIHAVGVFLDIYPPHDSEPGGMNPLQQQLALQLLDKLRQNMEGMYPAISRVLLAVMGPYNRQPRISTRTAHVMLRDCLYKELQKLPALHSRNPDEFREFLPPSVTYDPIANKLTHTYSLGSEAVTDLASLEIPVVDLLDKRNWQEPR